MVYSVNDNGEIVLNSTVDIKEHLVNEYYIIVPRYWAIDSIGVINSRKPIKVTENNSLMCYDEKEKRIVLRSISEYLKEPTRYYMIIRAPIDGLNKKAKIETGNLTVDVDFDYITGFMLIIYLKQLAGIENIVTTRMVEFIDKYCDDWSNWFDIEYDFYKKTYNSSLSSVRLINIKEGTPFKVLADSVITKNHNIHTIANEIYYSTNVEFVMGMLEALINTEKYMVYEISELITNNKLNPSIYTNCLNVLFSNYTITKAEYFKYPSRYAFSIRYAISPDKFKYVRYSRNKIKVHQYTRYLAPDGSMVIDRWDLKDRYISDSAINDTVNDLAVLKNQDEIKFLRFDELVVKPVRKSEPESLYDLIMGNGSATNYLLSCAPFSKNSDGDILAVMALMTKESLDASDKIMMSNADRLKDGTDPDKIRNWIQKDAVAGLYQATKNA